MAQALGSPSSHLGDQGGAPGFGLAQLHMVGSFGGEEVYQLMEGLCLSNNQISKQNWNSTNIKNQTQQV